MDFANEMAGSGRAFNSQTHEALCFSPRQQLMHPRQQRADERNKGAAVQTWATLFRRTDGVWLLAARFGVGYIDSMHALRLLACNHACTSPPSGSVISLHVPIVVHACPMRDGCEGWDMEIPRRITTI